MSGALNIHPGFVYGEELDPLEVAEAPEQDLEAKISNKETQSIKKP